MRIPWQITRFEALLGRSRGLSKQVNNPKTHIVSPLMNILPKSPSPTLQVGGHLRAIASAPTHGVPRVPGMQNTGRSDKGLWFRDLIGEDSHDPHQAGALSCILQTHNVHSRECTAYLPASPDNHKWGGKAN